MTYCIGIKTETGLVFASDSRTNAGLDNVNIYSKMLTHDVGDRTIVIVTSGNLGTSQAVYNSIKKDLKSETGIMNLNTCSDFEQIASYIGSLNIEHSSPQGINTDSVLLGSTFIVGGQIKDQPTELYLVYEDACQILQSKGVQVTKSLVGNYCTSLEMQGASITLLKCDDEILKHWDSPVHTAAMRWGM